MTPQNYEWLLGKKDQVHITSHWNRYNLKKRKKNVENPEHKLKDFHMILKCEWKNQIILFYLNYLSLVSIRFYPYHCILLFIYSLKGCKDCSCVNFVYCLLLLLHSFCVSVIVYKLCENLGVTLITKKTFST